MVPRFRAVRRDSASGRSRIRPGSTSRCCSRAASSSQPARERGRSMPGSRSVVGLGGSTILYASNPRSHERGSMTTMVDSTPASDDEALAKGLAGGDPSALRALHRKYAPLVFTMAMQSLGEAEAEEVVQDTFVSLWQK